MCRPPTPRAGPKGSARPRGPRREGGKVAGSPTTQPALSRYQAGRGPRPPAGLRSRCGGACHRAPSPSPPVTPSRPSPPPRRAPARPLAARSPAPRCRHHFRTAASVTSPTCASRQRMGSGSGLWAGPGRDFLTPPTSLAPPTSEAGAGPPASVRQEPQDPGLLILIRTHRTSSLPRGGQAAICITYLCDLAQVTLSSVK